MTRRGIEPLFQPWEGRVLAAWPTSQKITPRVGLEPTTHRLTADCSTTELSRIIESGDHLFSRAVSRQVSSAAYVLTIVFGMGTGVSHKRIATGSILFFSEHSKLNNLITYLFSLFP